MELNIPDKEGKKILVFVPSKPGFIDKYPFPNEWRGLPIINVGSEVTDSLSRFIKECLESFIEAIEKDKRGDFVLIFKHDDLEVLDIDNFIIQILGLTQIGHGVLGIAGTNSYNLNQRLGDGRFPNWHQMNPVESGNRGLIRHEEYGRSWWTHYGGPGEAKVIDGLCMIVAGGIAKQAIKFVDLDFDFHFYDIAFSWNAYKAGFSPYVFISDIFHHTKNIGVPDDFQNYAEKFFTKYADDKVEPERGHRKVPKSRAGSSKKEDSPGDGVKPGDIS